MAVRYKLLSLRRQRRLTQKGLADSVRVSRATISQLETGQLANPSSRMLAQLAKLFGVTVDFLIDDDKMFPPEEKDILKDVYRGQVRTLDGKIIEYEPVSASAGDARRFVTAKPGGTLVPLMNMNEVASGAGAAASEALTWVALPAEDYSPDRFFVRAADDSLDYAGPDTIRAGELALVARDLKPQDGDVVLAIIRQRGHETAALRVYREAGESLVLQPLNPRYPIIVAKDDVEVRPQGVVIKVIRDMRRS